MITQEQNQAFRAEHTEYMQQCTDYRALLTSMNLPFSVDLEALKKILRQRVADELLSVDESLKLRYSLLRTEAGRQKMREEVTASIDLAGYEDVEQLQASLTRLQQGYNSVGHFPDQYRADFSLFARGYELDLGKLLDSRTMYWEEKQPVLDYFTQLGQQLEQARNVMAALNKHHHSLEEVARSLTTYYQPNYNKTLRDPNWLVPDLERVYQSAAKLDDADRLTDFPNSAKARH